MILTKLAYANRFTDAELAAIYSAAKVSVAVEVWLEKFKMSEFIDLTDQSTKDGVHALESNGLIGPGRAQEILSFVSEDDVVPAAPPFMPNKSASRDGKSDPVQVLDDETVRFADGRWSTLAALVAQGYEVA